MKLSICMAAALLLAFASSPAPTSADEKDPIGSCERELRKDPKWRNEPADRILSVCIASFREYEREREANAHALIQNAEIELERHRATGGKDRFNGGEDTAVIPPHSP